MLAALSDYLSLSDVILIATLAAVGLLTFRSQQPRILKDENKALDEENKRLREETAQVKGEQTQERLLWSEQRAELMAQIRTLETRIGVLEGKDTERLYDLMKSHDERGSETSKGFSEVLQAISTEITQHIEQQQEIATIILPMVREIQQHIRPNGEES